MSLKEYPEIQRRVFKVIQRLIEDIIKDLEYEHTDEPWWEKRDLESLMRYLDELISKVRGFTVGGYTIFAYNVLLGVREGLEELLMWLEAWLDNLESDFAYELPEEEEGEEEV